MFPIFGVLASTGDTKLDRKYGGKQTEEKDKEWCLFYIGDKVEMDTLG